MNINTIKHLAFIMDGNQRWSKFNKKTILEGYSEGLNKIEEIIKFCLENKIEYLTLYALSIENFQRNSIYFLFKLINKFYKKLINKKYDQLDTKIRIIGEKDDLPSDIKKIFKSIEDLTINNNKLVLNLVFNYGTNKEILHIINKIISNNLELNNDSLKKNMYLADCPDPDLLIRTGGYQRLSNFILLNLSYTELYFTKTLWPDLKITEIIKIINDFENTQRNYGL